MHNDALHSLNLFYVLQIRRKRLEHQETDIIFLKKGYIVKSVVTSNRYLDKFITHHEIDYKYLNYSLLYLTRTIIINTVSIPLFIPISFGEVNQLLLNTLFQFIEHWFFFVSFFQQWSILRKRVREPLTLVFIFHTFKNLKCKVYTLICKHLHINTCL